MEPVVEIHEPTIIASPETTLKLGWISDHLRSITGSDILIVTREDLLKNNPNADPEKNQENLTRLFNQAGIPSHVVAEYRLHGLEESILSQSASMGAIDYDYDGFPEIGILIAPDLDMTPRSFVSMMTNIPEEYIKDNLPGTGHDYLAAVISHEGWHYKQENAELYYQKMPLPFEIDADLGMLRDIHEKVAEGKITSPDVNGIINDVRGVSGLGQDSIMAMVMGMIKTGTPFSGFASHSTHLILDENGMKHQPDNRDIAAMMMNNDIVSTLAGTTMIMESIHQMRENPDLRKDEQILPVYTDLIESFSSPTKIMEYGRAFLQTNPEMGYIILKALDDKGLFPENRPGSAYAKNVIGFFEKHIDIDAFNGEHLQRAKEFLSYLPAMDDFKSPATTPDTPYTGPQFKPH